MSTCASGRSLIIHCPKSEYIVCHCACSLKSKSCHDSHDHPHHVSKVEKNDVETQTDEIGGQKSGDLSLPDVVKNVDPVKCDQAIQTDDGLLDDQDLIDDAFLERIIAGFMDDDTLCQPEVPQATSEIPKESSETKEIREESSKQIEIDITDDNPEVIEESLAKGSKRKGSASTKELSKLKLDGKLWYTSAKKVRKAALEAEKKIAEMDKKVFHQLIPPKVVPPKVVPPKAVPSKPRRSKAEETWELLPDPTTVSALGNRYLEDIIRVDDERYRRAIKRIPVDADLTTIATHLIKDIIHPEYNLVGASFRGTSDKVSIMRKIFKQDPQDAKGKGKKRKSIYDEETLKLQVQESIIDHVLRIAKKTTYTLNDRKIVDRAITRAMYSINRAAATTSFIRH